MSWALPAFAVSLFVGAYVFGFRLARRGPKEALIGVAVCLPLVTSPILFHYFPRVETTLLSFDAYFLLRPWLVFPFAFCILGIGTVRMTARAARSGVTTVASALLLLTTYRVGMAAAFDPAQLTGYPNADGVCRQTSEYSCGPAAAATFLAHLGVRTDEEEMARLCGTVAPMGTDPFCMCHGLRKKLAGTGLDVTVRRCDWVALRWGRLPALAVVNVEFMLDHWVVVVAADDEAVLIADPTNGVMQLRRERFLEDWRGILISAARQH